MKGKAKCALLKQIRKAIARENRIEYVTSECKYQGDCTGTCPKCEAEVRYLETELAKRRAAGKKVAVAGIAAAMLIAGSGCELPESAKIPTTEEGYPVILPEIVQSDIQGSIALAPETEHTEMDGVPVETLMGEPTQTTWETEPIKGELVVTEPTEELVLMGDIPYVEGAKP